MENRNSVDQRRQGVGRFLVVFELDLRRQGAVVASYRRRNGRTLGPYYKLTCRSAGRQNSIYLGNDQPLVDEIRRRLELIQQPLQRLRTCERRCRILRAEAKFGQRRLRMELATVGLTLQGHEVRGWRKRV